MSRPSAQDLRKIEEGARRLARVLETIVSEATAGVTGRELTERAETLIAAAGGKPAFKGYGQPPFPDALCVSKNSCVVHGVPDTVPFAEGDLVGLDIGMIYEGWYSDMARTVCIEPVSNEERYLVQTAREALDRALALIRPGVTTGDIGAVIQELVESRGFGVIRDLAGHGVGKELHEPPEVPNFGTQGSGTVLTEGMVIAVEPMITMGDWHVTIAADHWSVVTRDGLKTAHAEDMILVTANGGHAITRL